MQKQAAREAKGGDGFADYYYFSYPPNYLTVMAPFATLPYFASFYAFMVLTGLVYLAAVLAILPSWRAALLAIAFPGALCTFIFGQNAFLTAGLAGLGLALLERRQVLAGVLIGLLCFKPQLGLAFPVVLAASGRWPAFIAAGATVVASVALSVALWGVEPWVALAAAAAGNKDILLDNSAVGFGKIMSLFAALRYGGVGVAPAYAAQALFAAAVAAALALLWRSRAAFEVKAAACLAGTLLMTPFALPYDLMLQAPAIAFLVAHGMKHGFARGETFVLAILAVTPAVATLAFEGPLFLSGFGGLVLLFGWCLARAAGDLGSAAVLPAAGVRA
jgi:hypothetical protein